MNKNEMLDKLEIMLKGMDVPDHKRRNPGWLSKNLFHRNSEHPNFHKVQDIVSQLLSKGIAF